LNITFLKFLSIASSPVEKQKTMLGLRKADLRHNMHGLVINLSLVTIRLVTPS